MKKSTRAAALLVLAALLAGVLLAKNKERSWRTPGTGAQSAQAGDQEYSPPPRLLEIGSDICIPCKMMEPIIEELKTDYSGLLEVEFINTRLDPEALEVYGVQIIPTQIFFDADNKELFRHIGFLSLEDIVAKWAEFGVVLDSPDGSATSGTALHGLFAGLTGAMRAAPIVAVAAALLWGILSVVLSPCHLSSIPLIVGFIGGGKPTSARRAFVVSLSFACGILLTILLAGAATALAGRVLGDAGVWPNYVVAAVLLAVGLYLLEVIALPWSAPGSVNMKLAGPPGAFLLGLLFGLALGPCTFAYMAPVLAVAFTAAAGSVLYGGMLVAVYGIGHSGVIVLAGTFTELVQRYLNWNEKSRGAIILKRACGLLVILASLWLIYTTA